MSPLALPTLKTSPPPVSTTKDDPEVVIPKAAKTLSTPKERRVAKRVKRKEGSFMEVDGGEGEQRNETSRLSRETSA